MKPKAKALASAWIILFTTAAARAVADEPLMHGRRYEAKKSDAPAAAPIALSAPDEPIVQAPTTTASEVRSDAKASAHSKSSADRRKHHIATDRASDDLRAEQLRRMPPTELPPRTQVRSSAGSAQD
jgi:hypothetical protein